MYNPFIIVPLASWICAQAIKFIIKAFGGQYDLRLLYASGGMPSAHSAAVAALASVALIHEGITSPIFGMAAVFAAVVLYDSLGVRRLAGEQATAFNRLNRELAERRLSLSESPLRELRGHTFTEVLAGTGLGFAVAVLFSTAQLREQINFLMAAPSRVELIVLVVLFAALVLGGVIVRLVSAKRAKHSRAIAKLSMAILVKTQAIGWTGLLLTFAAFQEALFLARRLWPVLVIVALVVWDIALWQKYRASLPRALAAEAEQQRKQRWLPKAKARR